MPKLSRSESENVLLEVRKKLMDFFRISLFQNVVMDAFSAVLTTPPKKFLVRKIFTRCLIIVLKKIDQNVPPDTSNTIMSTMPQFFFAQARNFFRQSLKKYEILQNNSTKMLLWTLKVQFRQPYQKNLGENPKFFCSIPKRVNDFFRIFFFPIYFSGGMERSFDNPVENLCSKSE